MTYRLDRLVERQAEFYLDIPIFVPGGIGMDFEYTLEEVRRKTGSCPITSRSPVWRGRLLAPQSYIAIPDSTAKAERSKVRNGSATAFIASKQPGRAYLFCAVFSTISFRSAKRAPSMMMVFALLNERVSTGTPFHENLAIWAASKPV